MLSFSQRKGLKPIRTVIQIEDADELLRNHIWNCIVVHYWPPNHNYDFNHIGNSQLKRIWVHYYGSRIDELPGYLINVVQRIQVTILNGKWNEMYDLLEAIMESAGDTRPGVNERFVSSANKVLEKQLSGYRIVGDTIVDITSEEELSSIEESLNCSSKYNAVNIHMKRALELFADRANPDYRNSIKESISAVESICSILTSKDTLGPALAVLEKQHGLHPTLKSSFNTLYGWTSDEGGIRHKMTDSSTVHQDDAKFMLVTCSAFINYLISKMEVQDD